METHPGSIRRKLKLLERTVDDDIMDAILALSAGLCLLESNAFIIKDIDGVMVLAGKECRGKIIKIIEKCLLLL
ncbi:MAG: hypothetical protein GSR74_02650 [Desulfurococcales archaeon]|nr:hypothetical protein [Desulfurococcales archaeon]